MIVVFKCPKCAKTIRADDQYAGRPIVCRACTALAMVPGTARAEKNEAQDSDDADVGKSAADRYPVGRPATEADLPVADEVDQPAPADHSYGLASLFLATFSFLLFFTPVILSGLASALGAAVSLVAGVLVSSGCFLCCRKGYALAKMAEDLPGGQGYAAAGLFVNKFLLRFYVLSIVFFVAATIVSLFFIKKEASGPMDLLKSLGGLGGLNQMKE